MRCPECSKQGKSHVVFVGPTRITLMGYARFYDQDDKLHDHNPNRTTIDYSCSNNHTWEDVSGTICWCGWRSRYA